ncbi:MAG: CdaR family protein [Spirochaetia bacterium]|nr:CdaR family protein [Spirochaetia bacterium]
MKKYVIKRLYDAMKSAQNNWLAKVVSVLIAIGLWLYNYNMQHTTISVSVPIVYKNKPSNLSYESKPQRYAKFKIQGKEESLNFSTANLKATVDLKDAEEGSGYYAADFDLQQFPENVDILEHPEKIKINLEKIVQKYVKINPNFSGKLKEGLKKGLVQINPRTAAIEGPRSILEKIKTVNTLAVDISEAEENLTKKIGLINPEKETKILRPTSVEISVKIFSDNIENELIIENIPLSAHNLDPALEAFFSTDSIKLYLQGNVNLLKKIKIEDIICSVNLEDIKFDPKNAAITPSENESGLPIDIKFLKSADNIQILNAIPDTVSVRFKVKPEFENKKFIAGEKNEQIKGKEEKQEEKPRQQKEKPENNQTKEDE